MAVTLKRRLVTVEEYHLMMQAGIFNEDDRLELLNGEIIEMSPIGSNHAAHVKRIRTVLGDILGKKVNIGVQDPIQLDDLSEPEPDISVLKPDPDYYANHHPSANDVFLVIEVAASSIEVDRNIKIPLYASAKIPVYWIVDLNEGQIEAYHSPEGSQYKIREIFTRKDTIPVASFGTTIPVKDLLGKAKLS